ncbi:hypothetical protein JVU11DRAFT_9727 [Chiua virens]|nr:hypothetical protein JVU11DRAFT_9727 [Chiua virens]
MFCFITEKWCVCLSSKLYIFINPLRKRIATESNMYDATIRGQLLFVASELIQWAIEKQDCISLDEFTELVLNVHDKTWHYYFIDHSHRLLFWVDPINMNQLGNRLQGVTQHSHIKYLVESLYWMHCEYYPHGHTLPKGIVEDLRGMLNHAKTDMMTGHSPSSPFAKDELVSISDLVNLFKDDEMNNNSYSVWVIARLMSYFTDNRFVNFCGQSTVRLNADKSLFEPPTWDRRFLFRAINAFLWGSPNEHAHRLSRVWVDNMIIQPRWKEFVDRLTTEWGRYTIFSTVMLAVDVSFLAVPGVIDPTHGASTIQIIIYCSIVATIASIVFSFTLLNAYTNPGLTRAVPADVYIGQYRGKPCMFSVESGREWRVLSSRTVFLWQALSGPLAIQLFGPKQRATIVTLGIECFIIVFFIMMCFSVTRMLCRFGDSEGDDDGSSSEEIPAPSSGDPASGV